MTYSDILQHDHCEAVEYRTGLEAEDWVRLRRLRALDQSVFDHVLKQIEAVSDTEWEVLTAFASFEDPDTTHGVILDAPIFHREPVPSNSMCQTESGYDEGMVAILYGTESSVSDLAGIVLDEDTMVALLRFLNRQYWLRPWAEGRASKQMEREGDFTP